MTRDIHVAKNIDSVEKVLKLGSLLSFRCLRHSVSCPGLERTVCGAEKDQNFADIRGNTDDNTARDLAAEKPRLLLASAHRQVTCTGNPHKLSLILVKRLLDVIHRRGDRENQLELFLVFEYLERDLADYISHLPTTTLIPSHQIQVRKCSSACYRRENFCKILLQSRMFSVTFRAKTMKLLFLRLF